MERFYYIKAMRLMQITVPINIHICFHTTKLLLQLIRTQQFFRIDYPFYETLSNLTLQFFASF